MNRGLADAPILSPASIAAITRSSDSTLIIESSRGPISLEPFRDLHDSRYIVCFPVAVADGIGKRREALSERDRHALSLDGRTIDRVALGEQQPETDHGLTGDGDTGSTGSTRWRTTTGAFEVALRDYLNVATVLRVSLFAHDEDEGFRILVDGAPVARALNTASASVSGTMQHEDFPIPRGLPDSVSRVVRVEAVAGRSTPRLIELRLLR